MERGLVVMPVLMFVAMAASCSTQELDRDAWAGVHQSRLTGTLPLYS